MQTVIPTDPSPGATGGPRKSPTTRVLARVHPVIVAAKKHLVHGTQVPAESRCTTTTRPETSDHGCDMLGPKSNTGPLGRK